MLRPHYAEFLPVARDNVRLHTHAGWALIYALKGMVERHIDGQEHALESSDRSTSTPAFPRVPPQRHLNILRHRIDDGLIAFLDDPPLELSLRKHV